MKISSVWRWFWLIGVIGMLSCATTPPSKHSAALPHQASTGYSLLFDLVSKQRNVSDIMIIKSASPETTSLIQRIAQISADAMDQVQAYAEADATLDLSRPDLPAVEQATRQAIESATAGKLIWAGQSFELQLLLTQYEATQYGAFLADQVARVDDQPSRRKWLEQWANTYRQLNDHVITQIDRLSSDPDAPPPG